MKCRAVALQDLADLPATGKMLAQLRIPWIEPAEIHHMAYPGSVRRNSEPMRVGTIPLCKSGSGIHRVDQVKGGVGALQRGLDGGRVIQIEAPIVHAAFGGQPCGPPGEPAHGVSVSHERRSQGATDEAAGAGDKSSFHCFSTVWPAAAG